MAGKSFLSKRAYGTKKLVQRIVSAYGNCCPVIRGLILSGAGASFGPNNITGKRVQSFPGIIIFLL
jgi:hypothetical protein